MNSSMYWLKKGGHMGIRKLPAFLFVMVIFFFLFSAHPAIAQRAGILLFQPEDEAVLPPGKNLFIGRVCGVTSGDATLVLKGGKRIKARLQNGVFFKEIELAKGKNRIQIEFPGTKTLSVDLMVKNDAKYRYHITDMVCDDCHKTGYSVARPEDSLCYRCHDKKDDKKFVHGPLAGGACAICHEPHGSMRNHFLKSDTLVLCTSCHDQNMSKTHIESAKNRNCEKCHNPHSSEKEFFLR